MCLVCVHEKQISRPDIGFLTVHPKYGYMGLTVDILEKVRKNPNANVPEMDALC